MTSSAQSRSHDAEAQFLEGLRAQYASQGFTFIVDPAPAQLPGFLGTYRPDAIAQKPGANIAIEVKRQPSTGGQRLLQEIRRLFDGHPDWQFTVAYMGTDPLQALAIPAPTSVSIRRRMDEVSALAAQGQRRAAFVMAWALLEATLHKLSPESESRPRTPGTVVQTLAMLGHIDPQTERRVRALIELRNRIVHGDLEAEPTDEQIDMVLLAISETLDDGPVRAEN